VPGQIIIINDGLHIYVDGKPLEEITEEDQLINACPLACIQSSMPKIILSKKNDDMQHLHHKHLVLTLMLRGTTMTSNMKQISPSGFQHCNI
jgi:hypothetical protein